MRPYYLSSFLLFFGITALSQGKLPLDTAVVAHWPVVENCTVTGNGRFMQYCIRNVPAGSATSVVRSIDGRWKLQLSHVENVVFSADSRKAIFARSGESLAVLDLSDHSVRPVARVREIERNVRVLRRSMGAYCGMPHASSGAPSRVPPASYRGCRAA